MDKVKNEGVSGEYFGIPFDDGLVAPEPPMCHLKKMTYCCGDSDDVGSFDEWFECDYCGHTKSA